MPPAAGFRPLGNAERECADFTLREGISSRKFATNAAK
jgi:hypothetical protein